MSPVKAVCILVNYLKDGSRLRLLRQSLMPLLCIYMLAALHDIAAMAIADLIYSHEIVSIGRMCGGVLFVIALFGAVRCLRYRARVEAFLQTNTYWPIVAAILLGIDLVILNMLSIYFLIIAGSLKNVLAVLTVFGGAIHSPFYVKCITAFWMRRFEPHVGVYLRRVPVWAMVLIAILLLRVVLFDTAWALRHYSRDLNHLLVGYFQYDLLCLLNSEKEGLRRRTDYLAVGSSQAGAVFGSFAGSRDDFDLFCMAGLGPPGFLLYLDFIKARRPETIILYLSEFDLGHPITAEKMKLSPFQGLKYLDIWSLLSRYKDGEDHSLDVVEMLLYDLFPEFKYRFVFHGYWNELMGIKKVRDIDNEAWMEKHFKDLANLDEKYFDIQLAFLREFLSRVAKDGIKVVIAEGQYHPRAFSEKNRRLHNLAQKRLKALAEEYDAVRYFPQREVYEFSEVDYFDGCHVHQEKGRLFSERLFQAMNRRISY